MSVIRKKCNISKHDDFTVYIVELKHSYLSFFNFKLAFGTIFYDNPNTYK